MHLNREQLVQARAARNPEELGDMLRGFGLNLPQEKVRMAFEAYHSQGEMAEEELLNVAGGFDFCTLLRHANGFH